MGTQTQTQDGVSSGWGGQVGSGLTNAGMGLMNTGVGAIPGAIIAGVGEGINAIAGANARREQRTIQQEEQAQQDSLHSQAMGQVENAVNTVGNTGQTTSGMGLASAGDFAKAVGGNASTTGAPAVAGANGRYSKAQQQNVTQNTPQNTGVEAYSHELATTLAAQDATAQAARINQKAIGDASANVSALQSQSFADQLVSQLASTAVQPNPYVGLAGTMLNNAGKYIGSNPWGSSAGSAYSQAMSDGTNAAGDALAAGGTDVGGGLGDAIAAGADV